MWKYIVTIKQRINGLWYWEVVKSTDSAPSNDNDPDTYIADLYTLDGETITEADAILHAMAAWVQLYDMY